MSSPLRAPKHYKRCSFGVRTKWYAGHLPDDDIPGPGKYPAQSYTGGKHGKKFSFYPRLPEPAPPLKVPAPNFYKPVYVQTESRRAVSFAHGRRTFHELDDKLGPGQYHIPSIFDEIASRRSKHRTLSSVPLKVALKGHKSPKNDSHSLLKLRPSHH